jgi:N6-adenosine-specific RNA methylase IME4
MTALPQVDGGFACIYADPPWHFRCYTALTKTNWTSRRDAEKHYRVLGVGDIAALPVRQAAARDAHLFLWTTGPCLPLAFAVIQGWGFRYSGLGFTWIKTKRLLPTSVDPRAFEKCLRVGLGMTTRKNAEFCLLARRGNARRLARDVREVIIAPGCGHSRKPDEAYDRIERYCAGPRLELFARRRRPGWAAWGDELPALELAA